MKVGKKKLKHIKTLERKIEAESVKKKVKIGELSNKIKSKEVQSKKLNEKFESIVEKISHTEVKSDNHRIKLFEVGEFNKKLQKLKIEFRKVKKELPNLKLEKKKAINDVSQNNLKKDKLESIAKTYEAKEKNKIEENLNEDLVQLKVIDNNEIGNSFSDSFLQSTVAIKDKVNAQKLIDASGGEASNAKLLNSWNDDQGEAGVEISYEREDGKSFQFEVSKKEGEGVEVSFYNNSLSYTELRTLKNQTGLKIIG